MRPVPSFLCVGMPKCGTSTLYHVLAAQDGIYLPPIKELNFLAYRHLGYHKTWREVAFSRHWAARQDRRAMARVVKRVLLGQRRPRDLAWLARYAFGAKDLDWYWSLFPRDRISGDISPSYCLLEPAEIEQLARLNPDLRAVILLRSPLRQIWSHCRMSVVRLGGTQQLAAFHANIEQLTGHRATYRSLVDDWTAVFGERVFVGYLEDMAAEPRGFFGGLLEFLGAPVAPSQLPAAPHAHAGVPYPVPPGVQAALVEHAALRLAGFETISPRRAAEWQAEIEAFRGADPDHLEL